MEKLLFADVHKGKMYQIGDILHKWHNLAFSACNKDICSSDWLWLLVLGIICTVYAYSAMVELLKRMSVFTSNLAINLEPVYGIILAVIFFKEYEYIHVSFYVGAMIILLSVATYPLIKRWDTRRIAKKVENKLF